MPSLVVPNRRGRAEDSDDDDSDISRENTPRSTGRNDSKRARYSLPNGSLASTHGSPSLSAQPSSILQSQSRRMRRHDELHKNAYQPGSIVRVKLTDFVTYTSAEFFPGPNLNMVIGPNGTGKSTLVCAICLGLGWGPQHLGRAKDISEFVKHGCREATIEIELAAGQKRRRNPVITRTIKREGNKSTFTIDGKQDGVKNVLKLARSYNIQVDNLCQFLPQDRVVEFAALSPVELLQSTQQAAGGEDMLQWHEDLKNLRTEQKRLLIEGKNDREMVENLEKRQDMSREAVERFRQRSEIIERLAFLERCRPIPQYREAKNAAIEAKEKKKRLAQELRQLRRELEPTLNSVNAKQDYQNALLAVVQSRKRLYEDADEDAISFENKVMQCDGKLDELDHRWAAELESGKKKKEDQKRLQRAIRDVEKQLEDEPEEFDFPQINAQLRDKTQQLRELESQANEAREQNREFETTIGEAQQEILKIDSDVEKLETSSGKQETKLEHASRDTYKAWKWIQQNQDAFKQHVYGPALVECSLKDPRYADAVESMLQNTDFLFFTCQNRDDFRLIQRILIREKRWTNISLRVSSGKLDQYRPPWSEDRLQQLGFDCFAIDQLNGPEPILSLLCSEKRLHLSPIALNRISEDQYQEIERSEITSWVAGGQNYLITRRYGQTSNRVRFLRKATIWTDQPVNTGMRRDLGRKKAEAQEHIESLRTQIAENKAKFVEIQPHGKQLQKEKAALQKEKDERQKLLTEFRALPTKKTGLEEKLLVVNEAIEGIKARLNEIKNETLELQIRKAECAMQYSTAVTKIRELHTSLLEAEILHIEARSDYETLAARNEDIKNILKAKEQEEKEAVEQHLELAEKARSFIEVVMKVSAEGRENAKLGEILANITADTTSEQLEAEIESAQAQLDLTHGADAGIVKEFEDREKRINQTRSRLNETHDKLEDHKVAIDEIRGLWEPKLDALVGKISEAFADSFARIGCAGQVSVYKASSNDDLDENGQPVNELGEGEEGNGLEFGYWAIHIYVKFRETEPLTLLDSHRQSGGERAVSTIFYLMALQSLSRAPFRVVDEINQGMDPRNERMVHGRMVDIACGNPGTRINKGGDDADEEVTRGSQYFLITPKLLSGLKYKRGMKVLCIVSGEQMPGPQEVEAEPPQGVGKVDFTEWVRRAKMLGGLGDRRVDSAMGIGRAGAIRAAAG